MTMFQITELRASAGGPFSCLIPLQARVGQQYVRIAAVKKKLGPMNVHSCREVSSVEKKTTWRQGRQGDSSYGCILRHLHHWTDVMVSKGDGKSCGYEGRQHVTARKLHGAQLLQGAELKSETW